MSEAIESLSVEGRTFPPPEDFKRNAAIVDAAIYDEASTDPEGFWARHAAELDWFQDWDTVLEWDLPFAKWFVGGKLNASHNCLDRHVAAGYGDGYARGYGPGGSVLIRNARAPIVGRVSMDSTTADVTGIPGASPGDEVVLVGRQGADSIPAEELASRAGTSPYEVTCRLTRRVPRFYRGA